MKGSVNIIGFSFLIIGILLSFMYPSLSDFVLGIAVGWFGFVLFMEGEK